MTRNPHIEYLKVMFGKERKQWEGAKDDRGIFCVIYDELLEAYEIAEAINNNMICCALNEYRKKEIATMQEIKDYFTGRTARNGNYFNPTK